MKHTMPALPYPMEALAPKISKETMEYHYGKHLQTYVNNLNKLTEGTPYENATLEDMICQADGGIFNNAAQTWNHTFFFETLTPSQSPIPRELADGLAKDFGSTAEFKEQFTKAATGLFGSGWVWLVKDPQGKLSITSEQNAGNPLKKGLTPLLVIDVWEHAYYIDYRNARAAYIDAFWELVNWEKVLTRYKA